MCMYTICLCNTSPSQSLLSLRSYAMRYIAMQLRLALLAKFPDTPQDDILKVVGNLLYYRYMNPAIVAPDAFDVVEMGVEQQLGSEQRRNLGAIAKILQTAAAGKVVSKRVREGKIDVGVHLYRCVHVHSSGR